MQAMQAMVGVLSWILIALFLWESQWKGRAVILGFVFLSVVISLMGDGDSQYLYRALGFALRVAIAIVYLIKRQLPVLSP